MEKFEPLNEKSLDDLSRKFADALFAAYPDWRQLAQMGKSENGLAHCLLLKVPAPLSSQSEYPLHIDTDNCEITVGFDSYHAHFDWPGSDEAFGPIEFIHNLIEERQQVVSFWRAGEWRGSYIVDTDRNLPFLANLAPGADKAKVRSWRGTYSTDHVLPVLEARIDRFIAEYGKGPYPDME